MAGDLVYRERPAIGDPAGLLVLSHGRGSHEGDLLDLADAIDPAGRLHVVAPRAPLELPGSPGYHWYVVPRVGYPDPDTFAAAYDALAAFVDEFGEQHGIPPARTVLGGFSMGAVMSYAVGLGEDRPRPAGILALSGFVPRVHGWRADLATRAGLPVFIAHGSLDPVIPVDFARDAAAMLEPAGLEIDYREFAGRHYVEPALLPAIEEWLAGRFSPRPAEGE